MKGLEILAWSLKSAGVKFCVLSHPGMDEIEKVFCAKGIDFLTPVSPTASAMIADGYARASGKPGVVISSREVIKLVTGVTSAWADKTPLVLINIIAERELKTCPAFGRGQADHKKIFQTITRFQARVESAEEIPETLVRAFREAVSLRGGPVFLEIPESVLETDFNRTEKLLRDLGPRLEKAPEPTRTIGDPDGIEKAVKMLSEAARPLIFSGGGAIRSRACAELNKLSELMSIPIISSMGGMGSASPENPMYIGPQSYLSGEAFHAAIKGADVVLAVGCAFSGLDGFGLPPLWSDAIKFIQVNIDPEHIAYNPPAELSILADALLAVSQMLAVAPKFPVPDSRKQWAEKLRRLNREHRQRILSESARDWKKLHPGLLVSEIDRILNDDPDYSVVLDGGNTCLWVGMLKDVPRPEMSFFPTGMGTLGSGLPMAIGVKMACPGRRVILISGDGSFLYNLQEFETLQKYKIPVLVLVMNDSAWNMIRTGQVSMIGNVYGTDLPDADYGKVAQSFGCFGAKVRNKDDIEKAVRDGLASGVPAVIDFETDVDCIPDSLNSFALVEMEGSNLGMTGMFKSLLSGRARFDIRLLNQIRYVLKSF